MQTFILGKDASLEETIAHFEQQLSALDIEIEEVSWLNPVPNVWSVHIRDKNCHQCFSNGKGSNKKAAYASALGEFFERLSTNYYFSDYYLGDTIANSEFVHYPHEKWFPVTTERLPDGLLDPYLIEFYDPNDELESDMLIDMQSSNAQRGICALPFIRQSDNEAVYIPVNILANLYVSNGMAAGNTMSETRVQALSEIFERYVKNKILSEAISLPRIPEKVIARFPTIEKSIAKLEEEGFPILSFDASLGGRYPVICVVLFNPENSTCFASFGAHPNFSVAFERTVTELLQGRSLNDLGTFSPPTFDNEEVAEQTNLETHFIDSSGLISWDLFKEDEDFPFVDWDFSGSTEDEFTALMQIFTRNDYEVYIADYMHLGVYACRILVPGISEIYPAEDLVYANNTMGITLRDDILTLPDGNNNLQQCQRVIDKIEDEGFDDAIRIKELLGLAPGNDDEWNTLRIGELKAYLYLAVGDLEQAQMWIDWTMQFNAGAFSARKKKFYRCLQALLELALFAEDSDIEQYYPTFCKMFGADTVDRALAHINQDEYFYDLYPLDSDLGNLPVHKDLLTCYNKVQKAKKYFY